MTMVGLPATDTLAIAKIAKSQPVAVPTLAPCYHLIFCGSRRPALPYSTNRSESSTAWYSGSASGLKGMNMRL